MESFLKTYFDLKQIFKIVLTQSNYIWNSDKTKLFDIFIKGWRKTFHLWKMSKKYKFPEDWSKL